MDINAANMKALFQTFNTAFSDGMQVGGVRVSPEDLILAEIAMTGTSTTASAVHAWLKQIKSIRKWIGPRNVNNVDSGKLEAINDDYENTVGMSANAIADDQYGLYTPLIRAMGIDASNLWLKLAVNALIANGTWIDGKAFFAADHLYGEGNTINNYTASALSADTYKAAIAAMQSYKGDGGEPLEVAPRYLVCGPSLRQTAWDLVKNQFVVGGTTNKAGAIQNSLQGTTELRVSRRLVGDYANYWFILGEMGGIKPVYVQTRKEPSLVTKDSEKDDNVFMENEVLYGVHARGTAFLTLPHLAYGGIVAA